MGFFSIESKVTVNSVDHTASAEVHYPNNEDVSLPIVMLLHGASGNLFHMSDPAQSPGYNYDCKMPVPVYRDRGWRRYPGIGIWSVESDPLKPITSWQKALNNAGFRTINYTQATPQGHLDLPIAQLSKLLGDVMNHFEHQGRRFVLLGHSRGGLLARSVAALPVSERHFDLTRIQQVITLHSPHQGSNIANIATAVERMADSLKQVVTPSRFISPSLAILSMLLDLLKQESGADAYEDFTVGSAFLRNLAAREPIPGIEYATFGGTSTVLRRHWVWNFTWGSKLSQWWRFPQPTFHWETVSYGTDGTPEDIRDLIAMLTRMKFSLPPELTNGLGDLLVTDAASRLPGVPHCTNPLNHAEALWDVNLQQQVISLIKAKATVAPTEVTYGCRIKLRHNITSKGLHSHPHFYSHPGSSGQQQVTAFDRTDDNDWWIIKGPHGTPNNYRFGQPVQQGDIIRLEHLLTQRNLHSHPGVPSPISYQQEVTCFGDSGNGDDNDNWRVELDAASNWQDGNRLRLVHANTNHALHSHSNAAHPTWTLNQQEVTCFWGRDDNDWWSVFAISALPAIQEVEVVKERHPEPLYPSNPWSEDRPPVYQP